MTRAIVGPNAGGTRRDFGLPGTDKSIPESVEERIFREARMTRLCRYCEAQYIAEKENQKFHDPRCGVQWLQGKIAEATFERWALWLREPFTWWNGQDDERTNVDQPDMRVYKREQDICRFDWCRRRFYLAIAEIQKRAERSAPTDAARAWKMLSEALLELWKLPQTVDRGFDLFRYYYGKIVPGEWLTHDEPGFDEETELPCRGLEALKVIADTFDRRWMSCGAKRPRDRDWLDF